MYCIHKWGNIHIAVDTLDTREHINTHNYAQIRIYMYARTKCAFTYIHTQARQTKHGQENTSGPCDRCDCNITFMQPASIVSPHTRSCRRPHPHFHSQPCHHHHSHLHHRHAATFESVEPRSNNGGNWEIAYRQGMCGGGWKGRMILGAKVYLLIHLHTLTHARGDTEAWKAMHWHAQIRSPSRLWILFVVLLISISPNFCIGACSK